ncbi:MULTISPECIES: hypothetical protein [unclassified Streptomyces]|uniref:hypothetical protein n=1 Tax=unclassified Streptomyces TaxID=2593676 RepID=UPI002E181004|nr:MULTISPECIES: hypothetical protein [unclassified Streptomyces]
MSAAPFRITCCLCRKAIPLSQDVYALDQEWQRRFPTMRGILACQRCTLRTPWKCMKPGSREYVDGHIAVPGTDQRTDFDAWSHVRANGTSRAMVMMFPDAGLLQGAETYLRNAAQRRSANSGVARKLRSALNKWDNDNARPSNIQV